MIDIIQTEQFSHWLHKLKEPLGKVGVLARIKRAQGGNFGDHKMLPNTGGIHEMRIFKGNGYRVYYAKQGETLYLLLMIVKLLILIRLAPYGNKLRMTQRRIPMTKIRTSCFDVAEYLTDETLIYAYLNEVLTDGSPSEFIQALNDVARAKGMNELAEKTGIRRESLYKTLQSKKPRFDTMLKIIDGMGLQLTLVPKQESSQLEHL